MLLFKCTCIQARSWETAHNWSGNELTASKRIQRSPIYPDSKASERRHPHAPPLFQHFKRGGIAQNLASARGTNQRVSSDTYILRNVSTDPELKQLYTSLGKAADNHDAIQAAKLCQFIKEERSKCRIPTRSLPSSRREGRLSRSDACACTPRPARRGSSSQRRHALIRL